MKLSVTMPIIVACALGSPSTLRAAEGAAYPERPIRLVIGFPPGGTSDTFARVLTPRLNEALGRTWVIDNRGGAGGNIASEIVVRAHPDGHTLLMALNTQLTVNPLLYKLSFSVEKDLAPVILLSQAQYMLVAHPSVKANSIKELIVAARGQATPLRYATAGVGSPHHFAGELFKLRAGIDLLHVPYKGGGPASAALLGNEVQVLFGSIASLAPHVRAGRVRALGMTGPTRSTELTDVPTIAESGFPGFDVTSWLAFLAPARTPGRIVDLLYTTTAKILAVPEVREQAARIGVDVAAWAPTRLAAQIKAETAVWADVIRKANIRME